MRIDCKCCGKPFTPKRPQQIYCWPGCRWNAANGRRRAVYAEFKAWRDAVDNAVSNSITAK